MNSRIRTTMDVVISCQVIDYYFGKSSIRDEERSCFLLWVLQTGFVREIELVSGLSLQTSFCQALWQGLGLPPPVDTHIPSVYWRQIL
ncbi:hypothetical protein Tco_0313488 [Tanacetum coccineum]